MWSPRLGLIVKPQDNLSLYASYSRSYLPQSGDQFSGLTPVTDQLKPERFDNYELGAKWEPIEGLLATAAVYQLDRTNTQARNALDQIVLTGAQRSRGVELGLERSITDRWQVSAGYAWQEAEISKTTAAAPKGRDVPLVPRHSFSLWSRYDFTPGIGAGLGLDRALEKLCVDQQRGDPARLRPPRRGALLQDLGRHGGAGEPREYPRRRLFPDRAQRQQYRPGRAADGEGHDRLPLLGGELRRAVADALEVVDELLALLAAAVLLGDAQQVARVHRHPAFAAVRQRLRCAAQCARW